MADFKKLEKKIGVDFKDQDLLRQALVHRSYLNEHPQFRLDNNERLEFLGDAVLEIIVTEHLFFNFPEKKEGELTNFRASLVNTKMLASVAEELELEKFLYLSKGESQDSNTKARKSILANAVEAIVGAIYLDKGKEKAKEFIEVKFLNKFDYILKNELYLDPKSKFQEKAQEIEGVTPHYKVIKETGPDHDKVFQVGLYLGEELISTGEGSSKQEAQVEAAQEGIKNKDW